MPKKIISLDELSRFKSKYDTQVSGLLSGKADKEGPLPFYNLGENGFDTVNVGTFLTTNSLNDKPFIISATYSGNATVMQGIVNTRSDSYSFEFEVLGDSQRFSGELSSLNVYFYQLFASSYRNGYEEVANKVTSLSNSSTDAQYPSAKCVYDNLQNVREVAEGKCKCFVVSYNETEPTEENFIANRWKRIDGTPIATWADFVEWTTNIFNVRMDFGNQEFNSSNEELDISPSYLITTEYIVVREADTNKGDVILVIETNVPDRWSVPDRWCEVSFGGTIVKLYVLETATLDPSGYVDDHTIAPAYSNLQTYAVGDLVIYDHKLYRCTTAVSSAENFDSNKWVQASVSDTFVDLYRNQTISGVKTFSSGIKFGTNSKIEGDANNITLDAYGSAGTIYTKSKIVPSYDNQRDLGSSSSHWKDIYLSGYLRGATTLTQAQYDALVSGGTVESDVFYFIEE